MRPSVPVPSPCIALVVLLAACSSTPRITGDIAELPACGALPNCVNTQSGHGIHAGEPIQANAAEWQQLKSWIGLQDDWQIVSETPNFIHAVVTTPVMKFQDDVHLLFIPRDKRFRYVPRHASVSVIWGLTPGVSVYFGINSGPELISC